MSKDNARLEKMDSPRVQSRWVPVELRDILTGVAMLRVGPGGFA